MMCANLVCARYREISDFLARLLKLLNLIMISNDSSGVTSSIKVISTLTGVVRHVAHLGNTTSVIADRTISIDGKTSSHGRQDTKSSSSNTKHTSKSIRDIDGQAKSRDRDNAGLVTKSKTVDNIGGGTSLASLSTLTNRRVSEGSEVLSDVTNNKTGPETNGNADEDVPVLDTNNTRNVEGRRKEEESSNKSDRGHEDGRDKKLTLKSGLNLSISRDNEHVGGNERGDPRHDETKREDDKGEHKSSPVVVEIGTDSRSNNHGSARTLSKRTEKISTHTSDI